MKSNKRLVKFYDLKVKAHARDRGHGAIDLPPRSFAEIVTKMGAYLQAGNTCVRQNRAKTETWHVADVDVSADLSTACILVTRSDKLAADQAISDPDTRHFAVAAKVNNQGNAFSAHVVIKLAPVAASTYTAIIEDAVGIGSGDIAVLLKLLTKALAKADREFFMCNDPSNDPALRRFGEYTYEFRAHPSQEFVDEVTNGKLRGLELVQSFPIEPQFDGLLGAYEKKKVIHLKLVDAPVPLFDRLRGIAAAAVRIDAGTLRIIFDDTSDFRRTVDLDTKTLGLVNEDKYVRKARLEEFVQKLDTGYQRVHPEINAKMRALL